VTAPKLGRLGMPKLSVEVSDPC